MLSASLNKKKHFISEESLHLVVLLLKPVLCVSVDLPPQKADTETGKVLRLDQMETGKVLRLDQMETGKVLRLDQMAEDSLKKGKNEDKLDKTRLNIEVSVGNTAGIGTDSGNGVVTRD